MKPKTAIALLSLQAIFHLDSLVIQDIDERLENRLGRLHARSVRRFDRALMPFVETGRLARVSAPPLGS